MTELVVARFVSRSGLHDVVVQLGVKGAWARCSGGWVFGRGKLDEVVECARKHAEDPDERGDGSSVRHLCAFRAGPPVSVWR